MISKFVMNAGKYVSRKVANKTMEKISDTYDYVTDRILTGSKSLNVGEDETMRCYRAMPYDKTGFCDAVGNKVRDNYYYPWKSKRK